MFLVFFVIHIMLAVGVWGGHVDEHSSFSLLTFEPNLEGLFRIQAPDRVFEGGLEVGFEYVYLDLAHGSIRKSNTTAERDSDPILELDVTLDKRWLWFNEKWVDFIGNQEIVAATFHAAPISRYRFEGYEDDFFEWLYGAEDTPGKFMVLPASGHIENIKTTRNSYLDYHLNASYSIKIQLPQKGEKVVESLSEFKNYLKERDQSAKFTRKFSGTSIQESTPELEDNSRVSDTIHGRRFTELQESATLSFRRDRAPSDADSTGGVSEHSRLVQETVPLSESSLSCGLDLCIQQCASMPLVVQRLLARCKTKCYETAQLRCKQVGPALAPPKTVLLSLPKNQTKLLSGTPLAMRLITWDTSAKRFRWTSRLTLVAPVTNNASDLDSETDYRRILVSFQTNVKYSKVNAATARTKFGTGAEETDSECPICFSLFWNEKMEQEYMSHSSRKLSQKTSKSYVRNPVLKTACNHHFCSACLTRTMMAEPVGRALCPLCRTNLKSLV